MKKNGKINNAYIITRERRSGLLVLKESMVLQNANAYNSSFEHKKLYGGLKKLTIDCTAVEQYDSFFVLYIKALKKFCEQNNIEYTYIGMTADMERLIKTLSKTKIQNLIKNKDNFFYAHCKQIGTIVKRIARDSKSFTEFLGELIIKILSLLIHPTNMRWKDFPYQLNRAGVGALPICVLIVFLLGLVTGYTGALQLHQFGADMYIADLVGISITRELGPIMTAILIAGRSGSSFAAELGTMKVSEEIDALNTMGFDSMRFLVMPRVLAVFVAMPILTIVADIAGMIGGLFAALATLDITLTGYINAMQSALSIFGVGSGLVKSMIFGFLIATVGCFRGMQVSGGADSVGKFTTTAVVTGIFLIILVDAIFAFIFTTLGV